MFITIISIAAIILGPIFAVVISIKMNQYYLQKNSKNQLKYNVFFTLMQTRDITLNTSHIQALNSIDLVFYDDKSVIQKWHEYRNYITSNLEKDISAEDKDWLNKKRDFFCILLLEMSKSLRFKFEEADIKNNSYIPESMRREQETMLHIPDILNNMNEAMRIIKTTNQNKAIEGK
jgi:hypothetical protein